MMSEASDAAVAGSGDRPAWSAAEDGALALQTMYVEHGDLVHAYCRRTLGATRAADATQEVFLAAWRSRDRYRPEVGTMAGWLLGIARFKVIDILRSDGRQPTLTTVSESGGTQGVEQGAESGDVASIGERMLVAEALAGLSERAREMVRLAFFEELTHADIAERTNVPLGTVKSDIRRGLEQMRRHLGGFDDVS